jgi:hypothetical protein
MIAKFCKRAARLPTLEIQPLSHHIYSVALRSRPASLPAVHDQVCVWGVGDLAPWALAGRV